MWQGRGFAAIVNFSPPSPGLGVMAVAVLLAAGDW
jgi:hypothetical protein